MPFSRGSSWPRDQTWVFCIAGRFFTIWTTWEAHNSQKVETAYTSTGRWMGKQNVVYHTMEYYSFLKRSKTLAVWINYEDIMLSETSLSWKDKNCMILLIWGPLVQFRHSVVSNSLQPHESQHTRPPCPSSAPGVYSNSCTSSQWCHPAISSSVVPFSSCLQSLPASGSFPMSQLLAWVP